MSSKIAATPFFSVSVKGVTLNEYTPSVRIVQETSSHTVILLDVLYRGAGATGGTTKSRFGWTYLKELTPVRVTYGMTPTYLAETLGYVASYRVVKTETDPVYPGIIVTRVQYTILGASMLMQSTVNYAWKNISPSAIASKIAVKNGMRAIIHPVSTVYDYRLQNVSDFQFLTYLADELGYNFYVDNTDLYFVDPNIVIGQNVERNVPQFWKLETPGIRDTLEEFTPTVGTTTSENLVADRSMAGINPKTGFVVNAHQGYNLYQAYSAAPTTPFLSHDVRFPVESYAEAQQRLNASVSRNQYWSSATARVRGDYRVRPNHLVELVGQGLPDNEAGNWLVQKAVHNLTIPPSSGNVASGTYTTEMTLVRNQAYTVNVTLPSQYAPVMNVVPSRLVNDVWKSSNVGAQTYAG